MRAGAHKRNAAWTQAAMATEVAGSARPDLLECSGFGKLGSAHCAVAGAGAAVAASAVAAVEFVAAEAVAAVAAAGGAAAHVSAAPTTAAAAAVAGPHIAVLGAEGSDDSPGRAQDSAREGQEAARPGHGRRPRSWRRS